ncbi:DUF7010 family protein [Neptunicella sp.]|uniref:DUF7010 family protein n=1 Tax=Neptunicella sp. TaxID=2125986 RepID=UPI003F6947F7
MNSHRTLDFQRREYTRRRFFSLPLASAIVWFFIGLLSAVASNEVASVILVIGIACIPLLNKMVTSLTGENLIRDSRPTNCFDQLYLCSFAMSLVGLCISLPFFLIDKTSLPLTVGILTGLPWLTHAWITRFWIGIFHTLTRSILVLVGWYIFPDYRFTLVPMIIVSVYVATIYVLELRWRDISFSI